MSIDFYGLRAAGRVYAPMDTQDLCEITIPQPWIVRAIDIKAAYNTFIGIIRIRTSAGFPKDGILVGGQYYHAQVLNASTPQYVIWLSRTDLRGGDTLFVQVTGTLPHYGAILTLFVEPQTAPDDITELQLKVL